MAFKFFNIQGKDKEEARVEDNNIPVNISFTDGSSILASNARDTGLRIRHRDGSLYELMMFDVSNYAKEGETIYMTPNNKVVVEKAVDSNGNCAGLTREEMFNYAVEYVGHLVSGYTNPSKICQYIGRKDAKTGDMIISETVRENYVYGQIEPMVKEEIKEYNERKNREYAERQAKEMDERVARAREEEKIRQAREDKVRADRIASGRFELVRGSKDGRADNYDGVDLDSGDVLRVRNLCKVGKDINTNVYLYTANVSTTANEHDVEILTSSEKVIAFATKVKIDQLAQTPAGKRKALEIFTKGNKETEYGDGLKFIGNYDENAELISTELTSCPESIQHAVESMSQQVEENQKRMEEMFRKANRRSDDEREI